MLKEGNIFNLKKNIIAALLAFSINVGLVFLSYKLVIQQSGIEAVGLWSVLFAWTTMIRIGDAGMANASLRFIALCDPRKEQDKIKAYLETGVIANALLFTVLGVVGYKLLEINLSNIIGSNLLEEAKDVLPVMMSSFVLMNISGVLLGSLQGLHIGYINSLLGVAGNVVQIGFVVLLVPNMGIAGLAWAQLVQHGLTILIAWVIARQRVNITAIVPLGFSLSTFREMFRFSVNAQVANIANGLFEPLTKILIGHYGGMRVLGIYELAFKTLWLPRTAIIGGVSAMMPALTTLLKFEPDKVWALYQKSAYKSTLAVVATSVCAIMASPFISLLWLGSVDTDYSIYMVILSLGIIINAWGASAYNLGVITGKMKNNIKVNLFVLLLLMLSVPMFSLFNLRPELLIVISALCLALGGYGIRKLNENLLQTIIGVK